MRKSKQRKLSVRITIYCIVFACMLSIVIGSIGSIIYYRNSVKRYQNYIRSILGVTEYLVDGDDIKECIRTLDESAGYKQTWERINHIKERTDIAYLYMITPDTNSGYMYIMCGYTEEERSGPEIVKRLGDPVLEAEMTADTLQDLAVIMAGTEERKFIINRSDLGYFMTGSIPIKTSDDSIIAVLSVDIAVGDIITDLLRFITIVVIGTSILVIVFSLCFLTILKKSIIQPILALGKHADAFVEQTNKKPSEMVIEELKIQTGDELERLSGQLNHMMATLVAYMSDLESATALQERMAVQLNLAKQIQTSMLPREYPAFPERTEFDIYAVMKPAKTVSGDFYDFFMTDGTRLGFVIAEVSGGGVPAALFMMITKTLIKNYCVLGLEPAKVLIEANNELCANNDARMTVTAFIGILDVYSGLLTYAGAGAHTPMLKRRSGRFEYLTIQPGFLLGTLEKIPFYQEQITLDRGDTLCLFTKGIADVEKCGNGQFLIRELLNNRETEQEGIDSMLNRVLAEAESIAGDVETEKDFTMMAVTLH